MTANDFVQMIHDCKAMRQTVRAVDVGKTAVVTFTAILKDAVQYFECVQRELPVFVLIDWDGKNNAPVREQLKKISQKIVVYPHTKKDKIPQQEFCLYALDKYEFWQQNGILPLYRLYRKTDFPEFCLVTANVYNQFGKNFPFLPYIEKRIAEAFLIYKHLADEESKQNFVSLLKAYATGDPDYLPFSLYPQYEHPHVSAQPTDKVIVDGGALNGASAVDFAKKCSLQTKILAFEAVPSLYENCVENVRDYPNIAMVPYALWDKRDSFFIENRQGGSFVSQTQTEFSETCRSISLDEYFAQNGISDCSLIKLDIEGAEPEALLGAEKTIGQTRPKLQISIYHKIEQFFDIPLFLLSKFPDYSFYLGHHTLWFWETILYAKK